ncbi:MAG: hypothetical protein IJT30_08230 [Muribaculaceae bacterium]|nr:hypothetical protein [Muribaculaceae bacterium]
MFKLLLLIILFIILFPIVKMWMLMRRARSNVREAFERARQQAGAQDTARGQAARGGNYDSVGEYAEFEELTGVERAPADEQPPATTEQQVVDAEFEDL